MLDQGLDPTEAKRNLVTIQEITDIKPIPKADKIEVATVLGWQVVMKKDEYQVGDKVVFFEIDSFLPDEKRYAFLGKTHRNPITMHTTHVEHGHRLSTVKLRGQISQGLLMPLSEYGLDPDLPVGTNVTEQLHVTKYAKPEVQTNFGRSLADFPSWLIDKTDEIRVQNGPQDYRYTKNKPYYMTYKYDGTSITVGKITKDGEPKLIVASRNRTLDEGSMMHNWLAEEGLDQKLLNYPTDITLQGEFYGPDIQSNRLGVHQYRWAIFNVEIDHQRVSLLDMLTHIDNLGLEMPDLFEFGGNEQLTIPIKNKLDAINENRKGTMLNTGYGKAKINYNANRIKSNAFNYSIDELLALAETLQYPNNTPGEGLVIRPLDNNHNNSFKAINNQFLLKYHL